ncbi:hypothetical protein [Bradyrhizobium diazoefficiens]|uniref:hypothetical protein n=1 Tax=Bradyrhizobium diazoefficiens TaxID=1355477 RepID=UPI00272BB62C|nr:hypothetical protein [Bradyrhizobium diazoefficiens]WLA68069.1 hypothetical protein QNN01_16210 [Bradyrhizobium diazoefficiens]
MRTRLIVLSVWLLINILFVVVMIPPRKPRASNSNRTTGGLMPAPIPTDGGPPDDGPPASLRHVIIAIGLGVFFSLTPPLLEAYEALNRWLRRGQKADEGEKEESILTRLREEYDRRPDDRRGKDDSKS